MISDTILAVGGTELTSQISEKNGISSIFSVTGRVGVDGYGHQVTKHLCYTFDDTSDVTKSTVWH